VPATRLGMPTTSLGAPGSVDNKPGSASDKPVSTSNHCRAVWEKQHLFEYTTGASGNDSYYLLFTDIQNSCIHFVFSSMNVCIKIATHRHMVYLDW
jgi:hypothetical protein